MTKTYLRVAALALFALSGTAKAVMPVLYEEAYAQEEEKRIIEFPIAGIYNNVWYDYRIDVTKSQKELAKDLRKADDIHDRRHAWEEYASHLSKDRHHYVKQMAKLGYRDGRVSVG